MVRQFPPEPRSCCGPDAAEDNFETLTLRIVALRPPQRATVSWLWDESKGREHAGALGSLPAFWIQKVRLILQSRWATFITVNVAFFILICWLPIIADLCGNCKLEVGSQAQGDTSRRADGVAREEPAEIDYVEDVGEVLSIDLKAHRHVVGFINLGGRRGIDLEGGIDAAAGKVDAIENRLPIFRENLRWIAVEFEGEAGVILNSACDPEARCQLVAKTSADGVALILRIGKMAGGRDALRVATEK